MMESRARLVVAFKQSRNMHLLASQDLARSSHVWTAKELDAYGTRVVVSP